MAGFGARRDLGGVRQPASRPPAVAAGERFEISREVLAGGGLSPHLRAAEEAGLIALLPDEAREANRRATLARHRPDADLWVFACGSLMWNPACDIAETRPALVRGRRRSFCLWTLLGRGSPELPGLTLGLEPGGSCRGLALRIAARKVEEETALIWRREMIAGAYRPVWVRAVLPERTVPAVAFAMDRGYERYDGRIPFRVQAHHIGCAEGPLGPCIEYLERTVASLEVLGQRRGAMHALLRGARAARRLHLERDGAPPRSDGV